MDFVHTTGAGGCVLFAKMRLPQALPEIFTGLKVGAALSATAAVVAEFVASDRGLGYLLLQYNGDLDTPMVFATVMLLGADRPRRLLRGGTARAYRHSVARLADVTGESELGARLSTTSTGETCHASDLAAFAALLAGVRRPGR